MSLEFAAAKFEMAAEFLNTDTVARTECLLADVQMPDMSGPECKSI